MEHEVIEQLMAESAGRLREIFRLEKELSDEWKRAERAETRLAKVEKLLATWRRNRADPRYGSGAPGPLYVAGMAVEADMLIGQLAEALKETR